MGANLNNIPPCLSFASNGINEQSTTFFFPALLLN